MSYPVWDVAFLGSGLVVAILAILHVLVSHLAIGGGAFLFGAELWAARQEEAEQQRIRAFLHRFGTFFLVFTTVFGAVTGVGIWFSIQLANPEATSLLIHQYAFAWAIEWVAFLGELSVLYLYYYGWEHNTLRMQRFLAGAYFVIAWASLFIINGILTFMLTPGRWTPWNHDLAAGFFNPGFAPSLLVRTLVMLLLAALAAILVATRIHDDDALKVRVIRFAVKWAIPAAVLLPPLLLWYWSTLPANATKLAEGGVVGVMGGRMEAIARHAWLMGTAAALLTIGLLVVGLRPRVVTTTGAVALLLTAQLGVLGAEFFREMARKPYVIYGVLYSNGLWKSTDDADRARPFLGRARWHPEVAPLSREHGEWVFRLQCVNCHTRDGYRGLLERTSTWTVDSGERWLERMDAQGVMPPFQGTAEDRKALAKYLVGLRGGSGEVKR